MEFIFCIFAFKCYDILCITLLIMIWGATEAITGWSLFSEVNCGGKWRNERVSWLCYTSFYEQIWPPGWILHGNSASRILALSLRWWDYRQDSQSFASPELKFCVLFFLSVSVSLFYSLLLFHNGEAHKWHPVNLWFQCKKLWLPPCLSFEFWCQRASTFRNLTCWYSIFSMSAALCTA